MLRPMALTDLAAVSAFIDREAARLDPASRYISDLRALVAAAKDLADLETRALRYSRGERHAGADVFARMTLEEKLRANLVTAETTLFRFAEGELEAIDQVLLPLLHGRTARALIVPCSHGEEAFTLAAWLHKVRVPYEVDAFDVQPALIAEAQTGQLTFGYPVELLAQPGRVSEAVLTHLRFQVGDAFALPLAAERRFELVLCRNFLGYFVEPVAVQLAQALAARVARPGLLFVDSFCVGKFPSLVPALARVGAERLGTTPVFRVPLARPDGSPPDR